MNKLKFEDDYSTEVFITEENNDILLYLSDDLNVVDDINNIPKDYEDRILSFLENSNKWYVNTINRIKLENNDNIDIELISVHILTEPKEIPLIAGLLFRVSFDIEHGRGIKLNTETMEIIEYGDADVALG